MFLCKLCIQKLQKQVYIQVAPPDCTKYVINRYSCYTTKITSLFGSRYIYILYLLSDIYIYTSTWVQRDVPQYIAQPCCMT